jgi:5-methylcytosine-specific restriction protein A
MKYWIIPSNDHIFQIGDAMKTNGGLVDWRMSNKFSVGDIVFIYKTKPEQCIRYKMEILATGLVENEVLDQKKFWIDIETYYNGLGLYKYARLKFKEEYVDDIFSIHQLRVHGIKGNIQSTMQCKSEELLNYLLYSNKKTNDEVFDVDYPVDDVRLFEGALIKVMANKYERNQKARKQCVERKGYRCIVCGFDFETAYGEIGKSFIHVHHVVPISSIGEEYELNIDTDLFPVCPNCHFMLHRKNPPYTIEELKERMIM